MTCKGCTAQMEFDTDEKIIVGRVIDIDDIITFHGASIVEFETAMQMAVDGYLRLRATGPSGRETRQWPLDVAR